MPDKITFYAIIGGEQHNDNPHGLVRRLEDETASRTRRCGRTLAGASRPAIVEWKHGDFADELVEVSHEQASKIIEYFREQWGPFGQPLDP